MKTFNEKDLITWSNRKKAIIGKEYYYSCSIKGLQLAIEKGHTATLTGINDNDVGRPFRLDDGTFYDYYSCILEV